MMMLTNKRVLLGVTGGIAAYKSAELVRVLRESQAIVRVVMTEAAQEFITPLTLQALSGHSVSTSLLDPQSEAGMGHIDLARWADVIIVAPATADFIAKLAQGQASDLLSTLALASVAPLLVAPAMNVNMWQSASTQDNVHVLKQRGITLLGPEAGLQACGDLGLGRMSEPKQIAEKVASLFHSQALTGKKVLVTAGPTREDIDPVRYISNYSSGKMGYAIANAAIEAGAETTIITGPVSVCAPERAHMVHITSAQDMYAEAVKHSAAVDVFISAAAVVDYRPRQVSEKKLSKSNDVMHLELVKNPDIVSHIAQTRPSIYTVAFAAETHDLLLHAEQKKIRKKVNMIVANDVSRKDIGFSQDNNEVYVMDCTGTHHIGVNSKATIARAIIARIAKNIDAK